MEPIIERSCGLDVHKETVVACLLMGPAKVDRGGRSGHSERQRVSWRSCGTGSRSQRCTHVGMESTGVYWMPVYAVLEGAFELIVGNAAHIKNVPGRKTDVKDSEWIADLMRCRAHPKELRTTEVATDVARSDAVPAQTCRERGDRAQSAAAFAGDLQRQVGAWRPTYLGSRDDRWSTRSSRGKPPQVKWPHWLEEGFEEVQSPLRSPYEESWRTITASC